MKILISVEYFSPPVGGAEISLISLVQQLARKHEVIVLQAAKSPNDELKGGLRVIDKKIPFPQSILWFDHRYSSKLKYHISPVIWQACHWMKYIDTVVKECNPDLILTHLNFSPPTVSVAKKYGIPVVLFIRSWEPICFINFIRGIRCNGKCNNCIAMQNKIRYIFPQKWLKWNQDAILNADLLVANSQFTRNVIQERFVLQNPCSVVYPGIDTSRYWLGKNSREYITILNPVKAKGSDIFLEITKQVPEKKFLAVGNCDRELMKHAPDNVCFLPWTSDMRDVYSKTRILLVPSIWEEPFGRVAIEAGINAIPVIASNRGGLPEAVGDGGLVINEVNDVSAWINAIRRLDNEDLYWRFSRNAFLHAKKFDVESSLENFVAQVKSHLDIIL